MRLPASRRRVFARRATVAAAACAVFVLLSALRVHAQRGAALLLVRIYNRFGLAQRDVDAATLMATSLLENAGISVQWRDCRSASTAGDSCSDVLAQDEISIRFVAAPESLASSDVLGYSYVDATSHRGTLATVFPDRVIATAPEMRMAPSALLGRAMAHEIGHLLLGTNEHSAAGLMRAHWAPTPQRPPAESDWRFSAKQAAQMHRALDARAAEPPLAMVAAAGTIDPR